MFPGRNRAENVSQDPLRIGDPYGVGDGELHGHSTNLDNRRWWGYLLCIELLQIGDQIVYHEWL